MAGLACARAMRRAGFYVEIFEKDRVIAGRMGTARLGLVPFDHGAQYVTQRTTRFKTYLQELASTGYAAKWEPHLAPRNGGNGNGQMQSWYVGTPGMSAVVRPLAESVRVNTDRCVHTLKRVDKAWHIWFDDHTSVGPFAAVAVCVPAPEARLILGRDLEKLSEPLGSVRMSPCWALMIRLEERVLPDYDVYSDMSQVIRWIGRNNGKPGRSTRGEHLVVHAAQDWSRETEDADPELVAEELWAEVCHGLDLPPIRPQQMSAHLWRHGLVERSLGETYLFSSEDMVGLAGDWCLGRLAEQAYESGTLLGRTMVDALT